MISSLDKAVFFRQFAALIAANVPLPRCCGIIASCISHATLRHMAHALKHDLESGRSVFVCAQRFPALFSPLACQLIRLGEQTGKLEEMLHLIADNQEAQYQLQSQIRQALFYPGFILSTSLLMTLGMLIWVVPRFAALFENKLAELPLFTRFLFWLSARTSELLLGMTIGVLVLAICAAASTSFRQRCRRSLTHLSALPVIRHYRAKISLSRFTRSLSLTLAAGMPFSEGLRLAGETCQHAGLNSAIRQLRAKVHAGLPLHRSMETLPDFPAMLIQMVRVGEETGKLEQMLDKAAAYLESEVEGTVKKLSQLLEPLIMVVLGVLIGGLVVGMYLPIFKLGSLM